MKDKIHFKMNSKKYKIYVTLLGSFSNYYIQKAFYTVSYRKPDRRVVHFE